MKTIFLFGFRAGNGKDSMCDKMEQVVDLSNKEHFPESIIKRTFFAKKLKQNAADLYNLDYDKFESQDYKNSFPPHLNGKSVRDILVEYGMKCREISENVWVNVVAEELKNSNKEIGIISDYRFPNEYLHLKKSFSDDVKLVRVLVTRPAIPNADNVADNMLSEDPEGWDEIFVNEETSDWKKNMLVFAKGLIEKYVSI